MNKSLSFRDFLFYFILIISLLVYPAAQASESPAVSGEPPLVVVEPGGIPEQVLEVYNKFMKQNRSIVTNAEILSPGQLKKAQELMTALYVTADRGGDAHGTVAMLIKKGMEDEALSQDFKKKYTQKKISKLASMFMARAREQMIESTMLEVIGKPDLVDSQIKQLHIARSDTGNPDSGMRSDLDQTFFVFEIDPETGAKKRRADLDQKFLDVFNTKWATNYGELNLKMLDVVSIKGSARFPDPRFISVEGFTSAFHRAAGELRNLEGAYISPSAIAQQVHKRQYDALTKLEQADSTRKPGEPPPRVWQEYSAKADNGKPGKLPDPDFNFAIREMIGGTPELSPHAGFSAAIANWMMLQHSFTGTSDFNVKYHLRTFDDSIYVQILQQEGGGMQNKGEYTTMTPEERITATKEAMSRLFEDDPVKQKHHKLALDISAEIRNRHTGASKGEAGVPDHDIYKPLLEELYPDTFNPADASDMGKARLETQLAAVKAYHKTLASEFCIKSARQTAPDAFRAMQGGDMIENVRPFFEVENRNWDDTKANLMEGARLTLLYGIYDLGPVEGYELMKTLEVEMKDAASRWDLAKLYLEAQFLPFTTYYNNPESYNRAIGARVSDLSDSARMYALNEWGFEKVEEYEAVGALLKKQTMVWNPHKLLKNMFWDAGSVASLAQVAEVFVTSKGDWDKVVNKALDEVLLAVPVVGQIENIRRGGIQGAVMLGPILYFPPAGKVLVAYNVAKSMYVITNAEYLKPRQDNAVDVIYRGFAGPETRAYGEPGSPPPIWTDAMEKEYQHKKQLVDDLMLRLSMLDTKAPSQYVVEKPVYTVEGTKKDLKKAQAEFKEIDTLRTIWFDFRDGSWSGGFWTGAGAVPEQFWVENSLLEDKVVEPVIGFLTGGVVDLRVDYQPDTYEAMLKEYEHAAENGTTIEDQIRAQAKIVNLKNRKEKWERAQRYIQKMKEVPELRSRFLRDSVYANIQEKKINMDLWVKVYFKENEKRLYTILYNKGLVEPAKTLERRGREYYPIPENQIVYLSHDIRKMVRERLQKDYERSRRLLAAYKTNLKHIREEQERIVKEQVIKFQNQGFAKARAHYSDQDSFKLFMNTLRFSYVKRKSPQVKMTFFKTVSDKEVARKGKKGDFIVEPYETEIQANIQLDHHLYKKPYRIRLVELNTEQMTTVPETIQGVPILSDTRKLIQELAAKHKDKINKGEMFIAVGTASSAGVQPLKGVNPLTYQGLPGYENGKAQKGEVILDQQIRTIETKPFTVTLDPIQVKVLDVAGNLVDDDNLKLTFADQTAKSAGGKQDVVHTFTRYDEELKITAVYSITPEKTVQASAIVSVNEIESWLEPSLERVVEIQLPVLMPGSVVVRGGIKLTPLPDSGNISKTALVKSGSIGVSESIPIPGFSEEANGRFVFESDRVLLPGDSIQIIAQTGGSAKKKKPDGTVGTVSVQYTGSKTMPVPGKGGIIDFGIITMTGKVKLVKVPDFDRSKPMPYKDYARLVTDAGLIPKPAIVDPPGDPQFAHSVKETLPSPGSQVPSGTEVAIEIFSGSNLLVPNVVHLHIKAATELLKARKITPRPKITLTPTHPDQEFTIIRQSIKPGTPFKPGLELDLEIYGRAAEIKITVPDLTDMPITKAIQATQKAGLKLIRDPSGKPAPDIRREGLIYQQVPKPGARVKPDQKITAWVYGKKGTGEETEGLGEATGPYYVVFSIHPHVVDDSGGKIKFPEKRENESNPSYKIRIRSFVNGIPQSRIKVSDLPTEKMVLPLHISGAGLDKYPRPMFFPGAKAAIQIYFKNGTAKPGDPSVLNGSLLLKVLGVYGSKQQVVSKYPKAKENDQFSSLAMKNAAGTCEIKENKNTIRLGPITKGWTQADMRESWNFWKELYIALGQMSCFVATVSYPDMSDPYFAALRQFRDQVLKRSESGQYLVNAYYRYGPSLAGFVVSHNLQDESRTVLTWMAEYLKSDRDDSLLKRTVQKSVIRSAALIVKWFEPLLEKMGSEKRQLKELDHRLPQSKAMDLLKGRQ